MRPLLFIIFPQGFRISKNIGHPTLGSGGKRRLNGTSKVNRQTDRQTDRRTFQLIESIVPEGQCFESYIQHDKQQNQKVTKRFSGKTKRTRDLYSL